MTETPDELLIRRAQQGDEEAVADLYRRHVPSITRYIGYRVSDEMLIEDLTAEVFLRMVEGLPDYVITGAPFEAWLYRIAAARIADYYRQRDRHPVEALTEVISSGQTPLEITLQEREELEDLRAALFKLSEDHQTILILRFVERLTHEEVSQIIGKSERAVATAQHRALHKLAELMGTTKQDRHYIRGK
jgi:RNA polymerase sigma-70 factor, ECF subfamily